VVDGARSRRRIAETVETVDRKIGKPALG